VWLSRTARRAGSSGCGICGCVCVLVFVYVVVYVFVCGLRSVYLRVSGLVGKIGMKVVWVV